MLKTNAEILMEARDLLTKENWRKGSYFKQENNTICMCAHGALQTKVNPVCKAAYDGGVAAAECSRAAVDGGAAAVARGPAAAGKTPLEIWNNRSDYVKQDCIYDSQNYGNGDAHYLLGMVGLTVAFNDHPDTTYQMVQDKFNEAIQLAQQLGA